MAEHPTAAKIRASYERLNAGDLDAYLDLFSDDVIVQMPPPYDGTSRGKAAYAEQLRKIDEFASGTMHVELETVLAEDKYSMAFMRGLAEHGDSKQDLRFVIAGEHDDEGRYKTMWYLANDQESHEEFWKA